MVGPSYASLADSCRSERRFLPLAVMRFAGALAAPLPWQRPSPNTRVYETFSLSVPRFPLLRLVSRSTS
jgi:hypothetical protein